MLHSDTELQLMEGYSTCMYVIVWHCGVDVADWGCARETGPVLAFPSFSCSLCRFTVFLVR